MTEPSRDAAVLQQALGHVQQLLFAPSAPDIPPDLSGDETLCQLHEYLVSLRQILGDFARGDLSSNILLRGFVAGALKALQAHLRHLTWQVQQVEKGDFSQRVDFLGDFSNAFNSMIVQLDTTLTALRQKEEALTELTRTLQREVELRSSAVLALRQSEAKFKYLAEHDPLTDALNRRCFLTLVEVEMQTAALTGTPCCIGLLDVDYFKQFNDTYGHLAGDEALKHLVRLAASGLRQSDLMGRYGGEEFIFFFAGADLDQGVQAAERIRKSIESVPVLLQDTMVPITASIGVSVVLPHWSGERTSHFLQQIVTMADDALYQAKSAGRNRVQAAAPTPPMLPEEDETAS